MLKSEKEKVEAQSLEEGHMTSRRLKIVDLCAYFTWPWRSGGQERVHCMNKALSRYADVEQFSFTPVLMWKKTIRHSPGYVEHIHNKLAYTKAVVLLKWLGIRSYDFSIPFTFRFIWPGKDLKDALVQADIVQVEHPWLFSWVRKHTPNGTPIALVAHNVELELQKRFFREKPFEKSIINSVRRTEREAASNANLVIALSEDDRKLLSKIYGTRLGNIATVENGAMDETLPRSGLTKGSARKRLGLPPEKPVAIFIGSEHMPNSEAARFIEEELAPKMQDAIFLIVGGVRKEGRENNIVCTGKVDDISIPFAAADIALNPLTTGSGSSLKMGSYLSAGLPIVSTRIGARGLLAEFKKVILLSEIKQFGKATARLLSDSRLRKVLSERAKRAAGNYSWNDAAKKAIAHYEKI